MKVLFGFKYLLFILMVSICGIVSCSSTTTKGEGNSAENAGGEEQEKAVPGRNIQIDAVGFPGGDVRLLGIYGKGNWLADSAEVDASGKFAFKAEERLPEGLYFVVFPNNKYFQLLLTKDQHFKVNTTFPDFAAKMEIENSLDNKLFYENQAFERGYKQKFDSLSALIKATPQGDMNRPFLDNQKKKLVEEREAHIRYFADNYPNSFFTIFKLAGQNPVLEEPRKADGTIDEEKQVYLYKLKFWDNVDFSDARLLRTPVLHNKLERYMTQLTAQNPDSLIKSADFITRKSMADDEVFKYIANWIGVQYKESKVMGGEAVFVHMIDNFWTPELAFWSDSAEIKGLRKEANEMMPSLLGKTGQNVTCEDLDGNTVSLYDLQGPIKVVYIYTPECENCRKETPLVRDVYNEWKNKGVDVFAICTHHKLDEIKDYVAKNNLTWTNVWDPQYKSGYHIKYHIDITPELYVLDKNNRIVGKNLKANQLETIFKRVMKEQ